MSRFVDYSHVDRPEEWTERNQRNIVFNAIAQRGFAPTNPDQVNAYLDLCGSAGWSSDAGNRRGEILGPVAFYEGLRAQERAVVNAKNEANRLTNESLASRIQNKHAQENAIVEGKRAELNAKLNQLNDATNTAKTFNEETKKTFRREVLNEYRKMNNVKFAAQTKHNADAIDQINYERKIKSRPELGYADSESGGMKLSDKKIKKMPKLANLRQLSK